MWLASKRGTAAADEGEAAQEHSTGAPSAESTAEGHGLGISDSSASEDMLEASTDSDSDWRNDKDTTDSESGAPQARQPPLLAPDELYPERTLGSGEGALSAMATPQRTMSSTSSRRQKGQATRPATPTWPSTSQERLRAFEH
jgi:hypothetical protein